MDREQARLMLRERLPEYLAEVHGIRDTSRLFRCLNPEHEDSHPSMGVDASHERVHCFSCGYSGDIIDLIRMDQNLETDREAFKWGYEHYGIDADGVKPWPAFSYRPQPSLPASQTAPAGQTGRETQQSQQPQDAQSGHSAQDFTAYFEQCASRIEGSPAMEYLNWRAITAETIQKYKIGFDPAFSYGTGGQPWQAVIIPTSRSSYVARNVNVPADDEEHKRDKVRKRGASLPFNLTALEEDSPVFIVEGEIDALSVIECGGHAVGLGSTANVDALLRYIDSNRIKPRHPLHISLDNDEEGESAARKLAEGLGQRGIAFRMSNIAGDYKDPNEALIMDEFSFMGAVHDAERYEDEAKKKERDEYFKMSASGSMGDFLREIEHNKRTPPVSTGFIEIDQALGGGIFEGLYIIGAIASLGKTVFVMQIVDSIAKGSEQQEGRDILVVALEMSRFELMARSVSRETFEAIGTDVLNQRAAKTTREILNAKGHEAFTEEDVMRICNAEAAYNRYGNHIFFMEGIGDISVSQIRAAVERHVRITGQVPIVVVDYIQILAREKTGLTDKQHIDDAVSGLKKISRDYRTAVLAISSFNRINYKNPVAMESFKESGAIEYSSDVLIGLQLAGAGGTDFDVDKAKSQYPRQIEAVILKNRNGHTGGKFHFSFYAPYNFFEESIDEESSADEVKQRREFYKRGQKAAEEDGKSFYKAAKDVIFPGLNLNADESDGWRNYLEAAKESGTLDENGEFAGLSLEAWRPIFYKYSTADGEKEKKRKFNKLRESLKKKKRLRVENDHYFPDGFLHQNEIRIITEALRAKAAKAKDTEKVDEAKAGEKQE